ncbi:TetR/AcrR family transcriptional regulator [Microbacterium sp. Au-Mic1]|uniref:TetR-like C-terminal domain-containing protein n=1 Tax=Microbacterium sp. Au-Mic1 TaxID=2906457 RepID=UPI001E4E6B2B|nr:TetR-like C-terminal domain-containing protein [Microbacterium sp. Au-Mic1]MCE4025522.1 TetR/AcrR family transcriptional regulator [Microbacterium sp. Au-Mic1]
MNPSTPSRPGSGDRSRAIVAAARRVAEAEGWPAVTVRRLAAEIGFSQPILYRSFPGGRDEIVEQVMIEGFRAMADGLADPVGEGDRLAHVVRTYLAFARTHPALYEAMFEARTRIVFATAQTPEPLRAAFGSFLRAVSATGMDEREAVVRAELLWSMLHGVARLAASDRLDPALEQARLGAIIALFVS